MQGDWIAEGENSNPDQVSLSIQLAYSNSLGIHELNSIAES